MGTGRQRFRPPAAAWIFFARWAFVQEASSAVLRMAADSVVADYGNILYPSNSAPCIEQDTGALARRLSARLAAARAGNMELLAEGLL